MIYIYIYICWKFKKKKKKKERKKERKRIAVCIFRNFFSQNLRRGWGVNFKNIYNSNASVNGNFENSSPLKLHLISFFILNNKYYYSFIVFVYHIKRPLKFCISSFSILNNKDYHSFYGLYLVYQTCHITILFFQPFSPFCVVPKCHITISSIIFTLHCYSEAGMHLDNARQCGQWLQEHFIISCI